MPPMQETPYQPVVPLDKVEALRNVITDLFTVYDTSLDQPHPGYVRFRGHFLQDPAECFDELRLRFEAQGFTPMIREGNGRIALIGIPHVFEPTRTRWILNLLLFIATIFSTLLTGASYGAETFNIWQGWPFSLSILLILGAHELGHYFAARYHKVPVTLPYFIPLPFISLFGTLGAFIQLKAPVKNRRALFDVGAAGPLAGLIVALPILIYGLATSEVGPIGPVPPGGMITLEGNSLLYAVSKIAIFGQMLPTPNGIDVHLNQVAWAGWVGLLVTGLNLIPLGQLDGGHVAYVLFGRRARQLFWPVLIGLGALVIFTGTTMWGLWIVLLYFLGRNHAEPLDDVTPLDPKRRALAIMTLIIFILVFTPIPLQIIS